MPALLDRSPRSRSGSRDLAPRSRSGARDLDPRSRRGARDRSASVLTTAGARAPLARRTGLGVVAARVAVVAWALLLCACSDGRTLLVLTVSGAPPAAATLEVALTLQGAPAQEAIRFRSDGRALGLRLPAGSRGLLRLDLSARSSDDTCVLARGALEQPLAGEKQLDLGVTLTTLATPLCTAGADLAPAPDLPDLAGAPDLGGQVCQREGECGQGLACRGQRCLPCVRHGDCESGVCDVYQPTALGPGRCLPEAGTLYVFNNNGAACQSGSGARQFPLCTLGEAVARARPQEPVRARLLPSSKAYEAVAIGGDISVAIYGSAGEGGAAGIASSGGVALTINGAAAVLVDGVELSGAARSLLCEAGAPPPGPTVTLRRSTVRQQGIDVRDFCVMDLDRVQLRGAASGLWVSDRTALLRVSNSLLWETKDALAVVDGGQLAVRFSTLVNNSGPLLCAPGAGAANPSATIEDSIVFGNTKQSGSQLGRCTLRGTVVGQGDSASGGVAKDPALDPSDQRLLDRPANHDCCIDKALGQSPGDLLDRPRPQRQGYDRGAYELP